MSEYKTLLQSASATYVEKRSEFIGYASPAAEECEALEFIREIRARHSDARHNVYAYTLRLNNITRFSDDGEPHSTAGIPVLDVMRKECITDAVIVVTRYFGGVLLGKGGLVRAYSAAAKSALDAAGVITKTLLDVLKITVVYSDYQRVENSLAKESFGVTECDFGADVTFKIFIPQEKTKKIEEMIVNITCGRALISNLGQSYGG